jgi:hypothetical protein
MIGSSNSIKTMQLIEGSNQMDYLLVLLDFHDCSFKSNDLSISLIALCARYMIAFACGL